MRRAVLALLIPSAFAAVSIPAAPAAADDAPPNASTGDWLQWFNTYRAVGGVPPVTEDPALTAGNVLHSRYVVKEDEGGHFEDEASPWYTEEGRYAGLNGNTIGDDEVQPDGYYFDYQMRTVIHRLNLLDPRVSRSSFGAFAEPSPGYHQWAATLDVLTHRSFELPDGFAYPAVFPGNGSSVPFTDLAPEYPDVQASCPEISVGLPVTFMTGQVPDVTASSFTDSSGTPLAHCVFDETTFESDDEFADVGLSILQNDHTVALIPENQLEDGKTYTASITSNGAVITTTFTVAGADPGPGPDPDPDPDPEPDVDVDGFRVAGSDRVTTAVAASSLRAGQSATAAVIAAAGEFPDALAATPVAVSLDAPLLLNGAGGLDDRVATELTRVLEPGASVLIAGGERAVGADVADAIADLGFVVERVSGPDRYATAVALAERVDEPEYVFVASGATFPDALSAGAAAGANNGVVVLTAGEDVPDATVDYLDAHLETLWVTVGGAASAAVPEAEIGLTGADRYETAAFVAEQFFDGELAEIAFASGANFPDGLAAGAALRGSGPLLLVAPDHVPESVTSYLELNRGTPMRVFGGPGAIADSVVADLARTLQL